VTATRTFPRDVHSIPQARRFARDALTHLGDETLASVELMVSELTTNSIKHARSAFTLTIRVTSTELRVEVQDHGPGRAVLGSPAPTDPSGRGLQIVNTLSSRWGQDVTRSGKLVWFELEDGTLR